MMHSFPSLITDFSDVESLDDELAAALTDPDAFFGLRLDGLRHLSATVAAILAEKTHTLLSLDGLRDLSAEAARALGAFSGILSLRGLASLSSGAAAALGSSAAYHRFLDGLSDLLDDRGRNSLTGLVQQQQSRVGDHRAGNGKQLLLTSAELVSAPIQ